MAIYINEPAHTFNEYLLIPGYSGTDCIPANVSIRTPLVKFKKGEEPAITLNIPMVSAIMQSVSGEKMSIELARNGGVSFIYGSQSPEDEAAMVARVKAKKAGFVPSDSNLSPENTLADVLALKAKTGHSTIAITEDGTSSGKMVGIVSSRDYRVSRMDRSEKVKNFMTPVDKLVKAKYGITLSEANDIIWDKKINSLPVLYEDGRLYGFVFRKDYDSHQENPNEMLDSQKRFVVGAGINSRDYEERVPLLLEAGADVLCIDSSEGFSEWQKITLEWIHNTYGEKVKVGAGNVVDRDGFLFLAKAGADFVKVGIGGGSICITRETKGIGRGQATALIEVCQARDEYYKETGIYVPVCSDGGIVYDHHITLALAMGAGINSRDYEETGIYVPVCSDGGIVYDHHITLALAMGADFVMLGRYFARFDESPTPTRTVGGTVVKEYWGEGSNRARNWARYDLGGEKKLQFEEGVDSYVPYAGPLKDNVEKTCAKIKATMCNCGAITIPELQQKAKLTLVSATSIVEGGAHDVIRKEKDGSDR